MVVGCPEVEYKKLFCRYILIFELGVVFVENLLVSQTDSLYFFMYYYFYSIDQTSAQVSQYELFITVFYLVQTLAVLVLGSFFQKCFLRIVGFIFLMEIL